MNGGRVQKARREQPPVLAAMDGIAVQCAVRKQDAAGYLELIALDVAQAKCSEIGSHEQVRDQAGRFEEASGCIVDFHVAIPSLCDARVRPRSRIIATGCVEIDRCRGGSRLRVVPAATSLAKSTRASVIL
jgi:hypothetical protein